MWEPGSPHSGPAPWLRALSRVSRGQAQRPGLLTQQPAVCPSASLPPPAGAPGSCFCLPPTLSTPASVPPGPCSVARGCWGPGSPQVGVFTGALGPVRGGCRTSAHVFCVAGASVLRPGPAPMSIALWAAAVPMLGAGWPLGGWGQRCQSASVEARSGPGDTSTPPSGNPHSQASRGLARRGREGVVCGQPHPPPTFLLWSGSLPGRPWVLDCLCTVRRQWGRRAPRCCLHRPCCKKSLVWWP